MANTTRTLRSRLLGSDQPTDRKMVAALESRLADDESVVHQLASTGPLVHEHDDETRERGGGAGGTLLTATDRKLVFVIDTDIGHETADIPFTDLKEIDHDSGILSSKLSVRVWGYGTFRFQPTSTDGVTDLVEYARAASQTWQRVVAALQDARQHISTLEMRIEAGDMDAAADARESAVDHIETAADRITVGVEAIQQPLRDRVETVRAELRETIMRARSSRARDLMDEASVQTSQADYDAAYAALTQAREHFDRALAIAVEGDHDEAAAIQADIGDLADQKQALFARPLERAERARQRAQAASDPEQAALAWESALEHYRDAFCACWGSDADFEGDREALQMQIEWVVANLVRERKRLASSLEAEADQHRASSEFDDAVDRYAAAIDHFDAAIDLARQYRAGDETALTQRRSRLETKRRGIA